MKPIDMRDHSANADSETSDSAVFWPIGQGLLAELARELLNHGLPDPQHPSAEAVRTALKPLGEIDWELHQVPWRHIMLIPDNHEMTSWKIRNEERKDATRLCKRILRWQIGLDPLDADEVDELRAEWEGMLIPALSSDTADELWASIEDQAVR